jgi:hypothetical protein
VTAGKKIEGGRLSLHLALPETGRAYHFRKPEGLPELSFRAAVLDLDWAEPPQRLLTLALLLYAASLLALGRAPAPTLAAWALRSLGSLLLIGLALAAAASAKGALVALAAGAGVIMYLRRRSKRGH